MTETIGGITVQLVGLALDAAYLKHAAIANNIANVNSTGYVRKTVNFESQLNSIAASLSPGSRSPITPAQIAAVNPFIEDVVATDPSSIPNINIDEEMSELARNTVHYQALLRGLGQKMFIESIAINEGRK